MKQNYSKPQVEIIEMELSSGVLTDTSTVTVPTGGEGDNSRSTGDGRFLWNSLKAGGELDNIPSTDDQLFFED